MARQYAQDNGGQGRPVEKSTLSLFTLALGWLGSHKFYVGHDMLGAIYFTITVLGLVFTLYLPIWVTAFLFGSEFSINLGILILIVPFLLSVFEFFLLQRQTEFTIQSRYRTTGERLTLILASQVFYLILLLIPKVFFSTSS
jgi:TM2 domain-containing membrane protein YozV